MRPAARSRPEGPLRDRLLPGPHARTCLLSGGTWHQLPIACPEHAMGDASKGLPGRMRALLVRCPIVWNPGSQEVASGLQASGRSILGQHWGGRWLSGAPRHGIVGSPLSESVRFPHASRAGNMHTDQEVPVAGSSCQLDAKGGWCGALASHVCQSCVAEP